MGVEPREFWKHAFNLGIRGAHALRQKLNLDEDNFRFRAPYSHADSRNVYIYRGLDEVQKAAMCLMRWTECFDESQVVDAEENLRNQMIRVARQTVFDEQALRCRKLTEALVDTILFLGTNEEMYFKDYFYLRELVDYQNAQRDRKEFYDFTNCNSDHHIQSLKKSILKLENSGLEFGKRWYLQHSKSIACMKEPRLSSFRSRYKRISIEQGSEIATLLAKSYSQAYGESRDVHFSAHDTSSEFSPESSTRASNKVALLMFHLILKLQELSQTTFDESDDIMSGIRTKLEAETLYTELTSPNPSVPEWVRHFLAEN